MLAVLLAAAEEIIGQEGVSAATTTRIASLAGVSVGAVYRYLPNRDAVVEMLAKRYIDDLERMMRQLALEPPAATFEEAIGRSIDAFTHFYRTNPSFRAIRFGVPSSERVAELDRTHMYEMAHGIRVLLVAYGLGGNNQATLRAALLIQFSADAVIQAAFRSKPGGDKALLRELKSMITSYVEQLADQPGSAR